MASWKIAEIVGKQDKTNDETYEALKIQIQTLVPLPAELKKTFTGYVKNLSGKYQNQQF